MLTAANNLSPYDVMGLPTADLISVTSLESHGSVRCSHLGTVPNSRVAGFADGSELCLPSFGRVRQRIAREAADFGWFVGEEADLGWIVGESWVRLVIGVEAHMAGSNNRAEPRARPYLG